MASLTEDRFLDVDGVRLHWVEAGEASELPPVVLLHGLNNSCLSWEHVAPLLAKDRRVLMLDLPGHGQSARPNASYELEWYARIVAHWLEAIEVKTADLVGHSFGGGVAQMLLLECPKRVRRMVLVASGGLGTGVAWWLRLASLPRVVEQFGQPFMAVGTRLALRGVGHGITHEDVMRLSRLNAQPGSARAFARSVRDVVDWRGQRRNFLQRVHEIEMLPAVLVLWGDRDPIIPVAQGKAFADLLDGAIFRVFEGCDHYLHNERPAAFARIVRQFLDDPTVRKTQLKQPRDAHPAE